MAKRELTISLAAKCQLLFGFAVLIIIAGALTIPWQRMEQLTDRQPYYEARVAADLALRQVHQSPASPAVRLQQAALSQAPGLIPRNVGATRPSKPPAPAWRRRAGGPKGLPGENYPAPRIVVLPAPGVAPKIRDKLTLRAIHLFLHGSRLDFGRVENAFQKHPWYDYVSAVRASVSCLRCHGNWAAWFPSPAALARSGAGVHDQHPLVAVVRVAMPVHIDEDQLLLNRLVIIVSGLIGCALAIIVFYLITTRLILQPVRVLRNTAEKVAQGDLSIRSAISTGDEFQQLSETFNAMLATLKMSQDQLQATNRSLDTRVGELAQRNVDLFQANRIKSEFLTNVSHELRTPLNAIIGFAELLAAGESARADPRLARYVENILHSARQLLELINDLLDLAKIEAGKMVLRLERVNVPDICESLINFMKPLAQKKNLDVGLTVEGAIALVTTDPGRFQQILYNLLSNAIKFTPPDGQVRLTVSAPDGAHVKIAVRDTGPGIASEHHHDIFEKFHQLDASVTRQHSGTGLGLAISKELADMLGARIELVSATGEGATFSLIVPVQAPQPVPAQSQLGL